MRPQKERENVFGVIHLDGFLCNHAVAVECFARIRRQQIDKRIGRLCKISLIGKEGVNGSGGGVVLNFGDFDSIGEAKVGDPWKQSARGRKKEVV